MTKKSIYDDLVYQECRSRIDQIEQDTKPQWGKMSAAQMFAHCAEIVEVSNGKALENTPLIAKLFKNTIRKMVVGETPYPRSTKTHPQYLQVMPRDFERQKERLLAALSNLKSQRGIPIVHALFGTLTEEEKGWAMYKHLDHHLTQFGV